MTTSGATATVLWTWSSLWLGRPKGYNNCVDPAAILGVENNTSFSRHHFWLTEGKLTRSGVFLLSILYRKFSALLPRASSAENVWICHEED